MIVSPSYCAMMARYNKWQNASLVEAADALDDAARVADRGAFFGSIMGTFSHLLWGDTIWMSRFDGWAAPGGGLSGSATLHTDWAAFKAERARVDRQILGWADRLDPDDLLGDLSWHSGVLGRNVTRPFALCIAHFFNHQTHHRGQIHAMLTAAGARPGDTDLFVMPEDIGL
ncbi:DinB family protein [Roseovarius sp. ZX-A-9]|uniref:DinB family protein n=1 Tax=Roseovarius sp. ZX-A-9 TaxID=3014783 RepID=UPI00232C09C8|nr:DinB family protein [Roseovarius sp. ZX-A-9]